MTGVLVRSEDMWTVALADTWRAGALARLRVSRSEGRHCTDWHTTESLNFLAYGDGKYWDLTETWGVEGMWAEAKTTARWEKLLIHAQRSLSRLTCQVRKHVFHVSAALKGRDGWMKFSVLEPQNATIMSNSGAGVASGTQYAQRVRAREMEAEDDWSVIMSCGDLRQRRC